MRSICLAFALYATLAAQETSLPVERIGHALILPQVWLDGKGPFRMMIDTGSETSLILPAIARRLGLNPSYAVQHVTPVATRRVPALRVDQVRVGETHNRNVEFLIAGDRLIDADGVLGQNWLGGRDVLLDYRARRLVLNAAPPPGGIRVALGWSDNRPAIWAEINGRRHQLVIDSGAPALILFESFRSTSSGARAVDIRGDSLAVRTGRATLGIGPGYRKRLTAAWIGAAGSMPGLLPACAFASLYVSERSGLVILVP